MEDLDGFDDDNNIIKNKLFPVGRKEYTEMLKELQEMDNGFFLYGKQAYPNDGFAAIKKSDVTSIEVFYCGRWQVSVKGCGLDVIVAEFLSQKEADDCASALCESINRDLKIGIY